MFNSLLFHVLTCLLAILVNLPVSMAAEKQFYKLPYIVENGDTLKRIFSRFLYNGRKFTNKSPMVLRTIKENPEIDDWNNLRPGSKISLFLPINDMDYKRYQGHLGYMKNNFPAPPATGLAGPIGWKGSVFYMASYGKFTQEESKLVKVESYQNSPVTLGTAFTYYSKDSHWSYATSAYVSYLLTSGNDLDDKDVKVPPEVGLNFYPEYRFEKQKFTGYFGLDYERFSTFNMGAIQQNRTVLLDQNSVVYATVGVSKLISILGAQLFTKVSLSKSLVTTTETHSDGIDEDSSYEGYKFMWYLNKKVSQTIFVHTLFKYHTMDGPSKLTTIRLGAGFGYVFL